MNSFWKEILESLCQADIENPRLEVRLMAAHWLGVDSNEIRLEEVELDAPGQQQILDWVALRKAQHPLCKILKEKGFYKYDFIVSEAVLSPRPDTETLVEEAIRTAQANCATKILDLGTGSGCIILSILGDISSASGIGVDASASALEVASKNAYRLKLDSQVNFIQASWFDEDFVARFESEFDIIVSNPPYIPTQDILGLAPEVKNFDPMSALDGGKDGLYHYRQIAKVSYPLLKMGGEILLEGGIGQEKDIQSVFENAGFYLKKIVADLGGINRCIILKK